MSKLIKCKACGKEIAKGVKICPNCGKDQRNFFKRHKVIAFLLVIFIFGIIIAAIGGGSNSTSTTVNKTIPIAEYKAQCKSIAYDSIAREPDKYKNKMVKFTGQVIQVQDNGSNINLRVNVTKGQYNIYEDTIWVNYTYSANEKKILENDIVNLWGETKGTISYTSVLGAKITIPEINARCIELVKNAK